MMKKQYIAPSMCAYQVTTSHILEGSESTQLSTSNTPATGSYSKNGFIDDDDEEGWQ